MLEFYATLLIETDEDKQEFQTDLARNNITIKQCTEETEKCYHYCLQGDWESYRYVATVSENTECRYRISSVEHFEN